MKTDDDKLSGEVLERVSESAVNDRASHWPAALMAVKLRLMQGLY